MVYPTCLGNGADQSSPRCHGCGVQSWRQGEDPHHPRGSVPRLASLLPQPCITHNPLLSLQHVAEACKHAHTQACTHARTQAHVCVPARVRASALWARPLWAPLGLVGLAPLWAGPLLGRALMGRALVGRALMGRAIMAALGHLSSFLPPAPGPLMS